MVAVYSDQNTVMGIISDNPPSYTGRMDRCADRTPGVELPQHATALILVERNRVTCGFPMGARSDRSLDRRIVRPRTVPAQTESGPHFPNALPAPRAAPLGRSAGGANATARQPGLQGSRG